ncbi:hypothetical protein [Legionella bononiensis]|uniref:Uncharacterized protein n=1 Tax=Legionella bononiensis TaxID=2793102 RepID=A0ABS1W9R1_9GAMM|nr:hypothetical protein [Legionella bononiensis]MBL7480715.1 hypothetical protein [Legionella bononiensis]MBL7526086.1 hypothetical protein [Legionella bononiensis]MBL7563419.1 hypothetical protein [Legionella bononiensis]
MFGLNSGESLPQELINSYQGWDVYMGHLWYNLVHFCNIKENDTVIEVAPGSSSKIAQALAKVPFSGTLYVVEPHTKVIEVLKDSYKKWLPQATIIFINDLLEQALHKLPSKPDFILANHPLDDMLLSAPLTSDELDELFDWASDMSTATFDTTINAWKKLNNSIEQLTISKAHVFNTWQTSVSRLKPKIMILSQYPSYMMESKGLSELNRWGWELLQGLAKTYKNQMISKPLVQTILNLHKNYNDPHLGLEILNAQYWLLLKDL